MVRGTGMVAVRLNTRKDVEGSGIKLDFGAGDRIVSAEFFLYSFFSSLFFVSGKPASDFP